MSRSKPACGGALDAGPRLVRPRTVSTVSSGFRPFLSCASCTCNPMDPETAHQTERKQLRRRKNPLTVTVRHLHILLAARLRAPEQGPEGARSHIQNLAEALLVLWSTPFSVFNYLHRSAHVKGFDALDTLFKELFTAVKNAASLPTHKRVLQATAELLVCQASLSCSVVHWLNLSDLQGTRYSFSAIAPQLVTCSKRSPSALCSLCAD